MTQIRITGPAGTTRWVTVDGENVVDGYEAADIATARYNRFAGGPVLLHPPGRVCGDCTDTRTGDVTRAVSNHGSVTLETRRTL